MISSNQKGAFSLTCREYLIAMNMTLKESQNG